PTVARPRPDRRRPALGAKNKDAPEVEERADGQVGRPPASRPNVRAAGGLRQEEDAKEMNRVRREKRCEHREVGGTVSGRTRAVAADSGASYHEARRQERRRRSRREPYEERRLRRIQGRQASDPQILKSSDPQILRSSNSSINECGPATARA